MKHAGTRVIAKTRAKHGYTREGNSRVSFASPSAVLRKIVMKENVTGPRGGTGGLPVELR